MRHARDRTAAASMSVPAPMSAAMRSDSASAETGRRHGCHRCYRLARCTDRSSRFLARAVYTAGRRPGFATPRAARRAPAAPCGAMVVPMTGASSPRIRRRGMSPAPSGCGGRGAGSDVGQRRRSSVSARVRLRRYTETRSAPMTEPTARRILARRAWTSRITRPRTSSAGAPRAPRWSTRRRPPGPTSPPPTSPDRRRWQDRRGRARGERAELRHERRRGAPDVRGGGRAELRDQGRHRSPRLSPGPRTASSLTRPVWAIRQDGPGHVGDALEPQGDVTAGARSATALTFSRSPCAQRRPRRCTRAGAACAARTRRRRRREVNCTSSAYFLITVRSG